MVVYALNLSTQEEVGSVVYAESSRTARTTSSTSSQPVGQDPFGGSPKTIEKHKYVHHNS